MDCCYRCWSDCEAYLAAGHNLSGVYYVYPEGMRTGYDVYCDMTTDGGGWLVSCPQGMHTGYKVCCGTTTDGDGLQESS